MAPNAILSRVQKFAVPAAAVYFAVFYAAICPDGCGHSNLRDSAYFDQTWKFFAPDAPRENRSTVLRIRRRVGHTVTETQYAVNPTLTALRRAHGLFPPRFSAILTRLERRLWYPLASERKVYERFLSSIAATIDKQEPLGDIIALRGTVIAAPIPPPSWGEAGGGPRCVVDTGWFPYHPDSEPLW